MRSPLSSQVTVTAITHPPGGGDTRIIERLGLREGVFQTDWVSPRLGMTNRRKTPTMRRSPLFPARSRRRAITSLISV